MNKSNKTYIAIDLKSFYASVECVQRGLNPLTTNLVVADLNHTEKTICLAVTPSLKAYGISGRARYFEVVQRVKEVNKERLFDLLNDKHLQKIAPRKQLAKGEFDDTIIQSDPSLALDYMIAPPQMAKYIEVSSAIYEVYISFFEPDDIHVYSIDEVFIDATKYLEIYDMSAHDLTMHVIKKVLKKTGITATAGIGTNLFLAKVAMDIDAKKMDPDEDGVRISQLDEITYRKRLWDHEPLTDFWRVGPGITRRMQAFGLHTMGDIAQFSLTHEDMLYKSLGVNAELLIDHAWGWEPVTMDEIKSYTPVSNSLGSGQVLHEPYNFKNGRIVIREMIELLALDIKRKGLVTDQIVMTIGYDISNLIKRENQQRYTGEITTDWYGRKIPTHNHGTENLDYLTSSSKLIIDACMKLYDRIANPELLIRRFNITANHVIPADMVKHEIRYEQLDIFTDWETKKTMLDEEELRAEKESRLQDVTLEIQDKFGKNALLSGTNLKEGATTIERNQQIGGHRA